MLMERNKREPFKALGVVVGIVVDNKDPEGHYRIKVKYPWVSESDTKYTDAKDDEDFRSNWCRVATFMAGKERGAFWLPEVDDEVLVAFEHGDVRPQGLHRLPRRVTVMRHRDIEAPILDRRRQHHRGHPVVIGDQHAQSGGIGHHVSSAVKSRAASRSRRGSSAPAAAKSRAHPIQIGADDVEQPTQT